MLPTSTRNPLDLSRETPISMTSIPETNTERISRPQSLPAPPPSPCFPFLNPCRIPNCPLNEAGIHHNEGICLHHNKPQRRQSVPVLFGSANPPHFIWNASKEREEALARVRRDENVEENRTIAVEMADLVKRFCELHAV